MNYDEIDDLFFSVVHASCSGLRRILDLSTASSSGAPVTEDEIFVLEGPRSLIRVAKSPDQYQTEEDNRDMEQKGVNPQGSGKIRLS